VPTSASAWQTGGSKLPQFAVAKAFHVSGSASACMSSTPLTTPTVLNRAAHWYLNTPVPLEPTEPLFAVPPGSALFSGARE
jgi:hypothetical protein